MPIIPHTVTIPAGQSLSDAVDCGADFAVGIVMPTDWTAAHVSVLMSIDGINFFDLFHLRANTTSPIEFKFNVISNAILVLDPDAMLTARYLKLRSGEREKPIPQEAARVFTIVTNSKITSEFPVRASA